jgi:8-oxo-dGTP pyrophosphatase MutT (NUDIX family)
MYRQPFLNLLRSYSTPSRDEALKRDAMIAFVEQNPECFLRELAIGHITGSAWVINHQRDKVLLTHHRKLDKWLQLGGHCDGDADVLRVALREAVEESGVYDIVPISPAIFDIDIHTIPERRTNTGIEAEHLHYDARFLLQTDDALPLQISSESKDLRWVALSDIPHLTNEDSILRMVDKTLHLKHHL